ncbi:MAG: peroxide stress protein YaaA [Candidatus Hodarchaeales archaeon]
MKHQNKILLILSCGKKKADELKDRPMEARKAYRGPMYQVLNKRLKKWSSNLFLGIVSAKYGFLRSDDLIEYYDLKMTKRLALKHREKVISDIKGWYEEENFDLIYILMGKVYLLAVEGLQKYIDTKLVIEPMGGLGLGQQKLVRFIETYINPMSEN